jgi:peptidoglycan/LPS O-acetylase OafA/YrhL
MPKSTEMFLLVIFALMFFIYLGLIWNEHANDEREHAHQLTAGRVSFFSGTTILCIGIILQAMTHNIDPWLVITLGIMILTKILIRIYTQITQ